MERKTLQHAPALPACRAAPSGIIPSADAQQVPLLRRHARAAGARDVLANRGPLRLRQRPDELRAPPPLEGGDRSRRARRRAYAGAGPRPLLRKRGPRLPRGDCRRAGGDRRRLHAPDARDRAAAQDRVRQREPLRPGGRARPSLPGRRLRRRDGRVRPPQRGRPARGSLGNATRSSPRRPRRDPRFRKARQRGHPLSLRRLAARRDAADRSRSFTATPIPTATFPSRSSATPRSAASSASCATRASSARAGRTGCSAR